VIVQRQSNLSHIVATCHTASRFTGRLHGRQKQPDQYPDNRDHDQQLDQRKSVPPNRQGTLDLKIVRFSLQVNQW
jgi:hypothetical protein